MPPESEWGKLETRNQRVETARNLRGDFGTLQISWKTRKRNEFYSFRVVLLLELGNRREGKRDSMTS